MLSYNTSFHRSIKNTPFFLTYGIEPRMPDFPGPELRRKFYGESSTDDLIRRLLLARDVARRNNEESTARAEDYYNSQASAHNFKVNQLVLLDEHSFLHKNTKLAPKWSGPHRITQLKGVNNAELLLKHNGKKLLVHVNRLKPYIMPTESSDTRTQVPDAAQEGGPPRSVLKKEKEKVSREIVTAQPYFSEPALPPWAGEALRHPTYAEVARQVPPVEGPAQTPRRRGRPPKTARAEADPAPPVAAHEFHAQILPGSDQLARPLTRAMRRAQAEAAPPPDLGAEPVSADPGSAEWVLVAKRAKRKKKPAKKTQRIWRQSNFITDPLFPYISAGDGGWESVDEEPPEEQQASDAEEEGEEEGLHFEGFAEALLPEPEPQIPGVVVPPLLPPQGDFRSDSPPSSRSSSPERFATPPSSSSSEERFQPSTPDPLALTPPSRIQVRLQELDDRVRSELDPFHSPQFARFAAQPSAPTLPKVTLPPAPAAVRPSAVFGQPPPAPVSQLSLFAPA
jgi:hypothetical protein